VTNSKIAPDRSDPKPVAAGQLDPATDKPAHANFGVLWILLSGILLIAGIVIGTAVMIDSFRERTIASTNRDLENTTLLLARHFDQKFEALVDAQARLAKRLAISEITSREEFRRRLSTPATRTLLTDEISDTFDTTDFFLYIRFQRPNHQRLAARTASRFQPRRSRLFPVVQGQFDIGDHSGGAGSQSCHGQADRDPRPQTDELGRRLPRRHGEKGRCISVR
jgi:hypothetical protein